MKSQAEANGIAEKAFIAIFIGSAYGPNIQAAEFIDKELAAASPDVLFVIAGGVGLGMTSDRKNVLITGPLDDKAKYQWFHAADI
ncbi:MAG: hypothetical protein M0Z56_02700, partial [Desulfobacteraceae bacterium]|nr:hypothetical protein [Desulfobacteraceae bacterium]